MAVKKCTKCGQKRSIQEFYLNKKTKDGLTCWCKGCCLESQRRYRKKYRATYLEHGRNYRQRNREKIRQQQRFSRIKRKYGLSETQYLALYRSQNSCCPICLISLEICACGSNNEHTAFVDHDHITGRIRGLLCYRCNRALGGFKDRISFLERAIKYLG